MSKKLQTLVSNEGKSPEEIRARLWDAYINDRIRKLKLEQCSICGECRQKLTIDKNKRTILCICEGVLCSKCKTNMIRRPISNYFDITDGKVWHTPYFLNVCLECRKPRQE